ncbi:MAG: cupin, partial [Candidatus Velthaea sp.]
MKTTTTTQVTHYEIQKTRRLSLLEEWKGYHKTVIKRKDVAMHDVPARRIRSGVYAGNDGDRPTKNLDAT